MYTETITIVQVFGSKITTIIVFAPSVKIRYSTVTLSESLQSTTQSESQTSSESQTPSTSTASPAKHHKELTREETTGIGISVPLAFLGIFLGVLALLVHRRHKKKLRNKELEDGGNADYRSLKPELGTDAETQRYELHGNTNTAELDAVDTSYLKELGAESESAPGDNIIKIAGTDVDVGLVVVRDKS